MFFTFYELDLNVSQTFIHLLFVLIYTYFIEL